MEEVAKIIDDFGTLSADASPEELTTLIKTVVTRIVVTRDGEKESAHIYIKGSKLDDYTDFFESGINVDSGISDIDALCDRDTYRQRDSYLRRGSAAARLSGTDDPAGVPGTDRAGEDHAGVQPAEPFRAAYGRSDHPRRTDSKRPGFVGGLLPFLFSVS